MAHCENDILDEICNEHIDEVLVQEPEAVVEDDPWTHIICSNNYEFLKHTYRWLQTVPGIDVSFDDCHRPLSLRRFENKDHDLYFQIKCPISYREAFCMFSNIKYLEEKYYKESEDGWKLKVMVDQHYLTGDIDWKLIHMALIAETLSQYDNMMGLEMQRLRSAMEVREIEYSRYADKTESYILSELSKTNNDNVVHILKDGFEATELRGLMDGVKACGLFPKINRCKDICGTKASAYGARYNDLRQRRAWSYNDLYVKRDRDNYFYYGTTLLVDSRVYKIHNNIYIIASQQEHKCPDTRTWLTITMNCRKKKYNWRSLDRTLQVLFPETDTAPIFAKLYMKYGTNE